MHLSGTASKGEPGPNAPMLEGMNSLHLNSSAINMAEFAVSMLTFMARGEGKLEEM